MIGEVTSWPRSPKLRRDTPSRSSTARSETTIPEPPVWRTPSRRKSGSSPSSRRARTGSSTCSSTGRWSSRSTSRAASPSTTRCLPRWARSSNRSRSSDQLRGARRGERLELGRLGLDEAAREEVLHRVSDGLLERTDLVPELAPGLGRVGVVEEPAVADDGPVDLLERVLLHEGSGLGEEGGEPHEGIRGPARRLHSRDAPDGREGLVERVVHARHDVALAGLALREGGDVGLRHVAHVAERDPAIRDPAEPALEELEHEPRAAEVDVARPEDETRVEDHDVEPARGEPERDLLGLPLGVDVVVAVARLPGRGLGLGDGL